MVEKKSKAGVKTKKPGRKLSGLYLITGDSLQRKNKRCPKCGPGVFLAQHKDRVVCGKCSYMEMQSRK